MSRELSLHLSLITLLFALHFILPEYHHGNLARVMVLAVYAMAYNVMFGYTGLLSLGHAMFFCAGMYGINAQVYLANDSHHCELFAKFSWMEAMR